MNAYRTTSIALAASAAVYGLSFWAWHVPALGVACWLLIVAATFWLTLRAPATALAIVMAELVLGSKGYIFSLTFGHVSVSLRLGIFLAVFCGWLITAVRRKKLWGTQQHYGWFWLWLFALVAWAAVVGLVRNHALGDVYADANAFLYLGLVPAFGLLERREQVLRILYVMLGALGGLVALTATTQALFTHVPVEHLATLYRWVRDSGLGEITHVLNQSYRVFFQSQLYGAVLFFASLGMVFQKRHRWLWFLGASAGAYVVVVSLSRSFWLGVAGAAVIGFAVLVWSRAWRAATIAVGAALAASLIGYAGYTWTVNFPYFRGHAAIVQTRTDFTSEAAASSRRELLPVIDRAIFEHAILGSGWGTALTYRTLDPRVNVTHDPHGTPYTSTAFELGYHAFALQFGVVLFIVLLFLAWRFVRHGVQSIRRAGDDRPVLIGLWLGLACIACTHATSPYLNHPLGIGFLIFVAAATAVLGPTHDEH